MSRSPIPPARRAEILELAERVGPAEAGRRTGVPDATIRQWRSRSLAEASTAVVALGGGELEPASGGGWSAAKRSILAKLAVTLPATLDRIAEAVEAGDGKLVKDLGIWFGIGIDKAQLIAGEATARTESRSEVRSLSLSISKSSAEIEAEIVALRSELDVFGLGVAGG